MVIGCPWVVDEDGIAWALVEDIESQRQETMDQDIESTFNMGLPFFILRMEVRADVEHPNRE